MFAFLRRAIVPIITVALVGFVATIVLDWGLGLTRSQRFDQANVVAVVNGEEVSWDRWRRYYQTLYNSATAQTDGDLPETRTRELEDQAFSQVVQDVLLMQQAEKYKLTTNSEEVYQYLRYSPPPYIQTLSVFQTDGQFDYQKYAQTMLQGGTESFWRDVETLARDDVLKLKLQQLIAQNALVTEEEVRRDFLAGSEKVTIGVGNVKYVTQMKPAPSFSDEEVRAQFEANVDDYLQDAKASVALGMLDKVPSAADQAAAGQKIQALYDSVLAGEDFARLAEYHSEDPGSGRNGGDLGWFGSGRMVEEFDSLAFALDSGDVSEPFLTQFGWHFISHHGYRVDKETPPGGTEPTDVRKAHVSHILVKVEASQETLDRIANQMKAFRQKIPELGFEAAAEQLKIMTDSSGRFGKGEPVSLLGPNPPANDFGFNNPPGTISEVFESSSIFYVLQVAGHFEAGVPEFGLIKTRVHSDMAREAVLDRCSEKVQAFLADVAAGSTLEAAAKKHDAEYEVVGPLSRKNPIPGIGSDAGATGNAFSLRQPGEISDLVRYRAGAAAFELISRDEPDLIQFTQVRDSIYQTLLQSRAQSLLSSWYNDLYENSEIVNLLQEFREAREEAI
jgi:peptidyl-prolyl cis-trans isomerase D